jgi:hypothetical protein
MLEALNDLFANDGSQGILLKPEVTENA